MHHCGLPDVEPHQYRLGSRAASIVGMAEGLLSREGPDDDVVTHLRAIRDLALEIVREAESRPELGSREARS